MKIFDFILSADTFSQGEPRVLGLAMIPGHHVVSIEVEADSLEDAPGFGSSHWSSNDTKLWTFFVVSLPQLQTKNSCVTLDSAPTASWKYLDIFVSWRFEIYSRTWAKKLIMSAAFLLDILYVL